MNRLRAEQVMGMSQMSKLISYAQNFEDIMLWRALKDVDSGCYVDVGAQSPDVDSVSRLFHEKGWFGVHVEPTNRYAQELRQKRTGDLVLECAISDQPGALRFFEINGTGLSTLERDVALRHEGEGLAIVETVVPAISLDALLTHVGDRPIHWLKIDVEGAEHRVLRSWVSAEQRPWIVVVESTLPLTDTHSHAEWEELLLRKNYVFAYFDGLNRFYVSEHRRDLLQAFDRGPNIFDNFRLSANSEFCEIVNLAFADLERVSEARANEIERLTREYSAARSQLETAVLAHAAELKDLMAAQQQHSEALERDLSVKLATISESEQQLSELREQVSDLQGRLSESREQATEMQSQLFELREQAPRFEQQVSDLKRQMNALQEEKQSLIERSEHERRAVAKRVERVRHSINEELEAAYSRIGDLSNQAHSWWRKAEELRSQRNFLQDRIDMIESSHSWRITAPLRHTRRAVSSFTRGLADGARGLLRPMLVVAMRMVLAVRPLRSLLGRSVARFPGIRGRLVALATLEGLVVPPRDADAVFLKEPPEFRESSPYLSGRAITVYHDLSRALGRGSVSA